MEEWKNYEASILKKHQNEILKPDRLYQEYKMKNNQLKNLFEAKSK